ncbi:Phospholipid-transporting ATPase [Cercospora zeina]
MPKQADHDEGVRRRRSTHADDGDRQDVAARTADVRGANVPNAPAHEHRVRFSMDVDQRKSKKRKSDEMDRDDGGSEASRSPRLSVNTELAEASRYAPNDGEVVLSPGTAESPVPSPRNRTRGLSLRSSLFMRNMNTKSPTGIELQGVGSSSESGSVGPRPATAKKDQRTSITVAPVQESWDAHSLKPQKRVRGASALPNYQLWVATQAKRHLPMEKIKSAYTKSYKFILRIPDIPPTKDGRHIPIEPSRKDALMDERTSTPYVSNVIRSSKYNAWNFLPRQLFAQFSKLANAYFLSISILQMIPGLSTTGTYTTIAPLLFFVSLSMAKEGYEDLRRHRLDKAENNCEAKVLHVYRPVVSDQGKRTTGADHALPMGAPAHWAPVKWHSVQVGDIVKLERDDSAPADLVLLSSEGANNTAYVETMALDGETNLKAKQPNPATVEPAKNAETLAQSRLEIVTEDPNLDLYTFEGRLTVDGKTSPLTNNEVIYRGSILRNTPSMIGLVVYTGEECKIRMNCNKSPRIKAPALQGLVNKIVIGMVLFVLFLSLFNSIAYQVWQNSTEKKAWYIQEAPVSFGPLLTSFIIMFNTLIPLSLYVSLEIIKLAQMVLMNSDVDMYDEVSNTPFSAQTSTINEELGQVGYVFSDKTGTLTENVMKFRKMSVAGNAFLHDMDLDDSESQPQLLLHKKRKQGKGTKPIRKSRSQSRPRKSTASGELLATTGHAAGHSAPRRDSQPRPSRSTTTQWRSSAVPALPQTEHNTRELIRYLEHQPNTAFAHKVKLFILSIALCHTCLPERGEEDDDAQITFQASSPDELALVRAAQELGFLALDRNAAILTLKISSGGRDAQPVLEKYEVLDVIEFSSSRKRASVVVRMPDGRITVICKGADSVIMKRLRLANLARQKVAEIEKRTVQRRSMEAHEALRRQSSIAERAGSVISMPRTSNSLARRSTARGSIGHLSSIRDNVDGWLNEREHDVTDSPRVSSHLRRSTTRPLMAERSESHQSDPDLYTTIDEAAATDEAVVIERCLQHINDFATEGLRTLLYGHRFLSEDEYWSWKKIYHDATTSLVNRTELIEKAGEMIECGFDLGGATAIEDKLQQGVPETIDRLRRANIKMWMLTGDKRETAVNIGHSCRLIKDYSSVTILDSDAGDVEHSIAAAIIDINRGDIAHSVVVIDGGTLSLIQSDDALHTLFLDLAILTDSVVCCRASPSQKAGLVKAIKQRVKGTVTLAIGDGANDVAMILEASVGIGITGKEGLQAGKVSDYTIAQFRFLAKLLLVHGRWNYIRTCKYTVGTFYKEMLFYLTQALYQRYSGYSGTSLYESWSLSMFNTLFTSLTIIFLGIFEQDLRASTLLAVPELYTKGQRSAGFNIRVFTGWMFTAIAGAMIVYFSVWGLYGDAIFSSSNDIFGLGSMSFTACVIIIALKLQVIEQRYKSIMAVLAVFLSVGGWFLWNLILGAVYAPSLKYSVRDGIFSRFGREGMWWLSLIISVVAVSIMEVGIRAVKCAFLPTDVETFQTLEEDLGVRKRFEEASAPWLQQGWNHGTRKTSLEIQEAAAEQERREMEVEQLLSRPRTMETSLEEGFAGPKRTGTEPGLAMIADGPRTSTEIDEMLSRRFGNVRGYE